MAKQLLTFDASAKKLSETSYALGYKEQACFFLNAMWMEHEKAAEELWLHVLHFEELDMLSKPKKGKEGATGHALDEFQSARLLEHFGQTMTALERRAALKTIDVDSDGMMSGLEYWVYHYKCDIKTLMSRPQGVNQQLKDAVKALKEVNDEIQKIESKKKKLEKKAAGGGVKALSAKNELEQLLAADNLPLNRAVISAEAAVRKAQKSKDINSMGTLWFLERGLAEAKKYKPSGGAKVSSKFTGK